MNKEILKTLEEKMDAVNKKQEEIIKLTSKIDEELNHRLTKIAPNLWSHSFVMYDYIFGDSSTDSHIHVYVDGTYGMMFDVLESVNQILKKNCLGGAWMVSYHTIYNLNGVSYVIEFISKSTFDEYMKKCGEKV